MFYVEVVLESNGRIKDVKIHHDGTGERQVRIFLRDSYNLFRNFVGVIKCFRVVRI